MAHGFVYILANESMPGRYKIGHTFISPFERAAQLSKATGVPSPFTVVGFACFDDPQRYEAKYHERFRASRMPGREFFQAPLESIWKAISSDEDRAAECDVEIGPWCEYEERDQ